MVIVETSALSMMASRRMAAALKISLVLLTTFWAVEFQIGKPQAYIIGCGGYQQGDFVEWAGCTMRPRGIAERAVSCSASLFAQCA